MGLDGRDGVVGLSLVLIGIGGFMVAAPFGFLLPGLLMFWLGTQQR